MVHERRITNPARAFSVLRGFAIPVFAQQQDLLLELIGAPDYKSGLSGVGVRYAGLQIRLERRGWSNEGA